MRTRLSLSGLAIAQMLWMRPSSSSTLRTIAGEPSGLRTRIVGRPFTSATPKMAPGGVKRSDTPRMNRPTALRLQLVQAQPRDDGRQKRLRRADCIERFSLEAQIGVLQDIVRLVSAAQHAVGDREQQGPILLKDADVAARCQAHITRRRVPALAGIVAPGCPIASCTCPARRTPRAPSAAAGWSTAGSLRRTRGTSWPRGQ